MAVRGVIFDIGGVVVSVGLERYAERAARAFRSNPEAIRLEVAQHVRALEEGEFSSYEFWRRVGEGLHQKKAGRRIRPRKYVNIWRNLMLDSVELNLPLLRACQALAREGVVVGALSNAIEDHAVILEEMGVYAPFAPCLLSCRLGMRKPDPEIYKLAAPLAGLQTSQCLFVDDTEHNLPIARELGYRTHHYTNTDSLLAALREQGLLRNFVAAPPLATPLVILPKSHGHPPPVPDEPDLDEEPDDEETLESGPEEHSEESPLPGPPCDLGADPWLASEDGFPWRQPRLDQVRFVLNYAALAPSLYNCQPWRFRATEERVEILADRSRALPSADSEGRVSMISAGAASFNLGLALRFFGFEPVPDEKTEGDVLFAINLGGEPDLQASDRLSAEERKHFRVLTYQRTRSALFLPPAEEMLEQLRSLSVEDGVWLHQGECGHLSESLQPAVKERWSDSNFSEEAQVWIHTGDAERHDGVVVAPQNVLSKLSSLVFGRGEPEGERNDRELLGRAETFFALGSIQDEPAAWLAVGRSLSRSLLWARSRGLTACLFYHVGDRQKLAGELGQAGFVQIAGGVGLGHHAAPCPRRPLEELLA